MRAPIETSTAFAFAKPIEATAAELCRGVGPRNARGKDERNGSGFEGTVHDRHGKPSGRKRFVKLSRQCPHRLGAVRCWSITRGAVPARFCAARSADELVAACALRKLKRDCVTVVGYRTMARTHDREPTARALTDSRKVTEWQSSGRSA